jgi:hypothetical protein
MAARAKDNLDPGLVHCPGLGMCRRADRVVTGPLRAGEHPARAPPVTVSRPLRLVPRAGVLTAVPVGRGPSGLPAAARRPAAAERRRARRRDGLGIMMTAAGRHSDRRVRRLRLRLFHRDHPE